MPILVGGGGSGVGVNDFGVRQQPQSAAQPSPFVIVVQAAAGLVIDSASRSPARASQGAR
ncbi:MAG: hypothetical protein NVSMB9_02830 [Isosphaeraceae bacterium]